MINAFTVDVEDYYQVSGFERDVPRSQWDQYESRVVDYTRRMLSILDHHGVRATFFVLGWVAQKHPQLVREIQRAGHEIGSHSFWHRLVYEQTRDEFREDLRQSRDVLEDIVGQPVTLYRAPSFSITRDSLWALEILVQEGFTVDSSIFPTRHDRYGIPGAPAAGHTVGTSSGSLYELPPSVFRAGPWSLPVAGGGYFRLYPFPFIRRVLARLNQSGQSFVFYVHPWELAPDQPRMRAGSRSARWRHYLNLSRTENRLNRLLGQFQFGRICDVVSPQHRRQTPSWEAGDRRQMEPRC